MNQFEHFFNNVDKKHLIHKWVHYFEIYEKHFNKFKGKCPTILEIGVARGGSLDMWNYYFGNCNIIGIDIDPYCKQFEKDNVQIFIGDQGDPEFWDNFNKNGIYFDIIIDDGGHFMHQQIITFEKMYPMVKDHGVYLCEDTHTSYWKEWNRGSITFMDYSKNFVDNLNYFHQIPKGKCFDTFCVSFYDSIVVLDKRLNQPEPYDEVKASLREYRTKITQIGQNSPLYLNKVVSDIIKDIDHSIIVDIGCGNGKQCELFKNKFKAKFIGVDFSPATINYLNKEKIFDEVYLCSSDKLPLNDKSSNISLSMENLEHLYTDQVYNALSELIRISEYVIITTPAPEYCMNLNWLIPEINEAYQDNIPLTEHDYICLESAVHKSTIYPESMKKCGFEISSFNESMIYHGKTNNIDLNHLLFDGIKRPNLDLNYKDKYLSLLNKCVAFKIKIVDCFIFYNEFDLLSYRLNLLKDIVDYFVIVEATKTFTGKPKETNFQKLKENFKMFEERIIYIVVDDLPFPEPTESEVWKNEKFQRNCISRGIEKLKVNDNDILIFSDIDEIPDPRTLNLLKTFNFDCIYSLEQDLYYYNIESKLDINWYNAKVTTFKIYKNCNLSIDDIRWQQFNFIKQGGWHLSYFGDTNFIKNKIQNFSHQEYNNLEILNSIDSNVSNGLDLFRRYQIQKIPIHLNKYLPPNLTLSTKIFGFHANGYLGERGTVVAMYDYAYYIKKNYKVIIFYDKNNKLNNNNVDVIKKFEKEFDCYAYDLFEEVKQFNLEYFYNITGINNNNFIIKGVKNLTHVVFKTQYPDENENEIVAVISPCVSSIFPVVPHMVNLPNHNFNMRKDLGIPENATVFGRYGGYNEFNIEYVQSAIKETLNIYFLFANTKPFTESFHPNIIYLDTIVDLDKKVKFINTCDAMIHARLEGETFGLSIAEFSSKNKPILTTYGTDDNEHINLLGKSAIIYNEHNLKSIFESEIKPIESAYSEYTPEKVMDQFYKVFHLKNER